MDRMSLSNLDGGKICKAKRGKVLFSSLMDGPLQGSDMHQRTMV